MVIVARTRHDGGMNDTMTPPRTQPELVRPHDGRVIAGVASAVARRLDVGVGWIRVAFVLASFFGGLGILLYIVGWLTIRDEREATPIAERWVGDLEGTSAWVGIGLIVVAGLVLLSATNLVRGELVLAAGLFLAGVLLYRGRLPGRLGQDADSAPLPETAASASSTATEERVSGTIGGGAAPPPAPPLAQRPMPPPPAPPGPPSYLGRLAVAASLLLLGVMGLLDNLDVIRPGLRHYVAGVVLVLGIALLVGSFLGRARGLIVLGLFAMPILFVSAAVRLPLSGEWGDREVRPAASTELQSRYELSGGQLVLDLRDLAALTEDTAVSVDVGVGQIRVVIPPDAAYDVAASASVGIGAVNVLGVDHGGLGVDQEIYLGPDSDGPDLQLQLDVGLGEIVVEVTN